MALALLAQFLFKATLVFADTHESVCTIHLTPSTSNITYDKKRPDFVVPNEIRPYDAKDLINPAPRGAYVVVGGERALFDYLMAKDENVMTLIAVDMDPGIIRFHLLNSILLRMTPDRNTEIYRKLRIQGYMQLWEMYARQAFKEQRISKIEMETILKQENLEWWRAVMSLSKWEFLHQKPASSKDPFYAVNYLYDPELLFRIQKLALSGRYKAHIVDLGDAKQVENFVQIIKDMKWSLAFFDLSNAWQNEFPTNYLGQIKTGFLLKQLNKVAQRDSRCLITMGKIVFSTIWYRAFEFGDFRNYTGKIDNWTKQNYTWEDGAWHFSRALDDIRSSPNLDEVPRALLININK